MTEELTLHRYGPDAVPGLREQLIDVYRDARAELADWPFYSAEQFGRRLDMYAADPHFDLVTGTLGPVTVGYAFGGPLPANTRWWDGLLDATEPDLTDETGSRTFAFRELVVRKAYQFRGYGRRLHDALLGARPEQRATLLVRPDNPARELYLRWGWRVAGQVQPFPDSPVFDSLLRELRPA